MFNPIPPQALGNTIFHLTGHQAGLAVKAFPGVDNQDKIFTTEINQ
jgi:hypothetical protein